MRHLLLLITATAMLSIARNDSIRQMQPQYDIRQTNSIRDTIPTIGDRKVRHSLTNARKAINKKSNHRSQRYVR